MLKEVKLIDELQTLIADLDEGNEEIQKYRDVCPAFDSIY